MAAKLRKGIDKGSEQIVNAPVQVNKGLAGKTEKK
tara:strand:- start:1316 stop:1420 length:105 start_codon:yes stop_codon:yes gene_type:complete